MNRCIWIGLFCWIMHSLFAHDPKSSIVEIVTTSYRYDPLSPWGAPKACLKKFTGTFLQNGKILTSDAAIQDAAYIDIRIPGVSRIFTGNMSVVSPFFHLALLDVQDADFYRFLTPATLAKQDARLPSSGMIYTYSPQYPRLHATDAHWFSSELLDAEESSFAYSGDIVYVPAGIFSSGSPIFLGEELVGVAVQFVGYTLSQNYAEFISASSIASFLKNPERKTLIVSYQNLDNSSLREYFGMPDHLTGVLLAETVNEQLVEGDILLSIQGYPVENDGSIYHNDKKMGLTQFLAVTTTNDIVSCEILRNGILQTVEVSLLPFKTEALNMKPSYYVYAGLVFEPLYALSPYDEEESGILLTQILPDPVNMGYDYLQDVMIEAINDIKILSLHDVVRALENHDGSYHKIQTVEGDLIILDREASDASHPHILQKYGISLSQFHIS